VDGILASEGMANFYFYRFRGKNQGMFLPKDKDLAFALIDLPLLEGFEKNVLTRRSLALPELREHFAKEVLRAAQLAGGKGGWLEREIERVYSQVQAAAYEDRNKECIHQPCTLQQSNDDFDLAVWYMKLFAVERTAEVRRQLVKAGYPVPPEEPPQPQIVVTSGALPDSGQAAPGPLWVTRMPPHIVSVAHSDGRAVTRDAPAIAGEAILVQARANFSAAQPPAIMIGGTAAAMLTARRVAGKAGHYEMVVLVPWSRVTSTSAAVLTVGAQSSQPVSLPVR
jgi:hypothetical protein